MRGSKSSMKLAISTTWLLTLLTACSQPAHLHAPSNTSDALAIDEEVQTPEGQASASSTIYERRGDQYLSTRGAVPASLVAQIRKAAMDSQSKPNPDLKDFGITEKSVRENRETMLKSANSRFMDFGFHSNTSFENLPPEVQRLFEYDIVSKNALTEITGSMNGAYDCVKFSITGNPSITMMSRHRQGGMLPWRVTIGGRTWITYSRELPKLLAKIASLKSKGFLEADEPDFRFQDLAAGRPEGNHFWPNGFFANYGVWSRDAIRTVESSESAKKLPGWSAAVKKIRIEDALNYSGGDILIQTEASDQDHIIDKVRWTAEKRDRGDRQLLQDWNDFLASYKAIENAAKNTNWLGRWKHAGPGRSILALITSRENQTIQHNQELRDAWKKLGLPNSPKYLLQLFKAGKHCSDVFIGEPYQLSLATDLGYGASRPGQVEVVPNDSVSSSPLREHDDRDESFSKRVCAVIDQKGAVIRKTDVPPDYALPADFSRRELDDEPFNYEWPVDFTAVEDLDVLNKKAEGEEIEIDLPPWAKTKILYGAVSKDGKLILKPEFERLDPFTDGLALVSRDGKKFGFVDSRGVYVVTPEFDHAEGFHEGLAAVCKKDKWGFVDTKGRLAIPCVYDSVRRFSEGLAPARQGIRFGYIDKTGKTVIAPQFGRARHFRDGLAYVQIDEQRAYIDHSGRPIGGKMYSQLERFSDDRALFRDGWLYGYIDRQGHQVIPARFSDADTFRDGAAKVSFLFVEKFIDKNGNYINKSATPHEIEDGPFRDGLASSRIYTREDVLFGFKDSSGKLVIARRYNDVGYFNEGLCPVSLKGKWGAIDKSGRLVMKPQFEKLGDAFSENLIAACTGGKWGVVDKSGNVVLKPTYDLIYPFHNGIAVVQTGQKYGYIDATGKVVFSPKFDTVTRFTSTGVASVGLRATGTAAIELP
jgi:hypothetical protein